MCGKFNIQRICNLTEHVSLFGGVVKWRGKLFVSAPGEAGETFCYNRDGKKSNNAIVIVDTSIPRLKGKGGKIDIHMFPKVGNGISKIWECDGIKKRRSQNLGTRI